MRLALLLCVALTTAAGAGQSVDAFREHLAHPTIPKTPEHPSADYQRGFCDGYNMAAWSSRQNIDHYKAMLKATTDGNNVVSQATRTVLDAMDSFVQVPQLEPVDFPGMAKATYVDLMLSFDRNHPTRIRCDGSVK